jgi:hypothetical protein
VIACSGIDHLLTQEEIMKRTVVQCSMAVAAILSSTAALADNGTYESVISLVPQYKSMEHGDGTVTGGSSAGTSTIVKSSGEPFAEGVSSAFECVVFARKTAAGMDLEAPCVSTDASGDKMFSVARRKVGDVAEGGGGQGTSQIVGGTGRYAGLTGSCSYRADYLPGNRIVSTSKCRWQRP